MKIKKLIISYTLIILIISLSGCLTQNGKNATSVIEKNNSLKTEKVMVMGFGKPIQEGSFFGCVQDQTNQGIPVETALASCNYRDTKWEDRGNSMDPSGILGLIGRDDEESSDVTVSCSGAGSIDPSLAEGKTRKPTPEEKEKYGLDVTQLMYTDEEMAKRDAEYTEAVKVYENSEMYKKIENIRNKHDALPPGPEKEKAWEELKTAEEEEAKSFEFIDLQEKIKAKNTPYTPPLVSRPDPDAENTCLAIAEFVAKCNSNGWEAMNANESLTALKNVATLPLQIHSQMAK